MPIRLIVLVALIALAGAADPPAAVPAPYEEFSSDPIATLDLPAATRCATCGREFRDLLADPRLVDDWTCAIRWPDGRRALVCSGPCHDAFERAHLLRAARPGAAPTAAARQALRAAVAMRWEAIRFRAAIADLAAASGVAMRVADEVQADTAEAADAQARAAARAALLRAAAEGRPAGPVTAQARSTAPITWSYDGSAVYALDSLCQRADATWGWSADGKIAIEPRPRP